MSATLNSDAEFGVVGGLATDPVTGRAVGYVLEADAALLASPDGPDELRAALDLDPDVTLMMVRTRPGQVPAWPSAELDSRYLVHAVGEAGGASAGTSVAEASYTVRPTDSSTLPFVKDLLALAIADGHQHRGEPLSMAAIRKTVDETFFVPGDGLVSFVAADASGAPAGHITLRPGEQDELTERTFVEVVDMFILDGHQHTSCSRQLLTAAARVASAEGQALLGHVVWVDETGPAVYQTLQSRGWSPFYDLWRVRLQDSEHAGSAP